MPSLNESASRLHWIIIGLDMRDLLGIDRCEKKDHEMKLHHPLSASLAGGATGGIVGRAIVR
jgi:hypothetical protein